MSELGRISRRTGAALSGLVLLTAVWTGAASAHPSSAAAVAPAQALAALGVAHTAYARPDARSTKLERVPALRPLTNQQTVLPVLGQMRGADGKQWLRVRLAGRPNSHSGWIQKQATRSSSTPWHVLVQTSRRRVLVYRAGRVVRTLRAVVGTTSTPTPSGSFFVEEAIQLRSSDVGGPFALALSARSNVLQEFAGGPGQIALHGMNNVGGVLGSAMSHGCVRLANDVMRWLVFRIGPGTPVTITG